MRPARPSPPQHAQNRRALGTPAPRTISPEGNKYPLTVIPRSVATRNLLFCCGLPKSRSLASLLQHAQLFFIARIFALQRRVLGTLNPLGMTARSGFCRRLLRQKTAFRFASSRTLFSLALIFV